MFDDKLINDNASRLGDAIPSGLNALKEDLEMKQLIPTEEDI